MSPPSGWNFADVIEAVAAAVPDHPAVIETDGTEISWRDFVGRATTLAAFLIERGAGVGDKVAVCQRNGADFLVAYLAAFKARLVPVNVNYRYGAAELAHLLTDCGAAVVIYHAEFREVLDLARPELVMVHTWIEVADRTPGPLPSWTIDYGVSLAAVDGAESRHPRSGDDQLLLYTGGTTGLPKGVVWRQDDLFGVLLDPGNAMRHIPVPESIDQLVAALQTSGPRDLAACPYMHATGLFNQLMTMVAGGTSVICPGPTFEAEAFWDTAQRHQVDLVVIVGDVFAAPLADALDAWPTRWPLHDLGFIVSSGLTFSRRVKERLLAHLGHISIVDAFGSSEASGIAASVSTVGDVRETGRFSLSDRVRLLTDDDQWATPGSDAVGRVAMTGRLPLGYHGDPAKTAATFRTIEGVRYAVPGDYAQVESNGALRLLGRGASCINSGGEKIYPEEVDDVIKRHPAVADAACIGVPDERFGSVVGAVVELRSGTNLTTEQLTGFVKEHLAGYKAPRRMRVVDRIVRSGTGKLDHGWLRSQFDSTS
ncbi:MAG: AMP-binding protein [Ilumatobacteraceae bacterium]